MLRAFATESLKSPTALTKISKVDPIVSFEVEAAEFEVETVTSRALRGEV